MSSARLLGIVLAWCLLATPLALQAQSGDGYDASWYNPDRPYLQIDVTEDGVYRVAASALGSALPDGTGLSDISPETIRLFENGEEIPLQLSGTSDGTLDESDTITFVGRRNRGTDEAWAYNYDRSAQSSTYYSLYADTTTYWMTWGGENGLRYDTTSLSSSTSPTSALRDTVHVEQDNRYYFGRPGDNGDPIYTRSEGYYWQRFSHNDTSPISFEETLPVGRRTATTTELDLTVRLDAATNSCHRVDVAAELRQSDGSLAFETLRTVEWEDTERQTLTASVAQQDIPSEGLTVRLTSYNDNFSDEVNGRTCPDPSSTPNYVLLDWMEAAYTRSLAATNNTQRFVAPSGGDYNFVLSNHSGSTVNVYNPRDARRFEAPVTNGTASITASPSAQTTPYWAVGDGAFRTPASIRPDTPSNWSAPSANGADYVLLTTKALLPAAQQLADYRRTHDGYDVEIALVQNVFDEFDYGRPTPIAIRRFVRATQDWNPAPRFLSIFADAQYPIRDGSVSTLYPEWSVPSFGYAPSDGWYAMQTDGPQDWSEVLAVGRIPVRSVAQGELFVEKLKSYESAPLERWQKRMLLLAGGTSESEQESLQQYSNWWGEIAADTVANTRNYSGPAYTGMDTLRYYKRANASLDASFQDSLAVDLRKGAGWLNYFGHSAAQTWEIVTDPPSEFDNAGRLPIVSSIGCRTGSFAGGRFEEKSAPSLGEQLVVGSVRSDGSVPSSALNGAIAHFGESALGFRIPSARLNDALIREVFVDTSRVLGEAIRTAKAEIAADFGTSDLYAKHLLQYGLLGDPATNMALPEKPDLHVAPNLISVSPSAPTLSDNLEVSVEVQSRGLIPSDSVTINLTWQRPDGTTTQRSRRVERFPLEKTLSFSFSLDERALGTNTFRVSVDPASVYDEANETNNTAQKTQVVFSTGVELISPADQGIVQSQRPALQFSLPRRDPDPAPVTLQLDTVPSFDSPALQETTLQNSTLSQTWTPSSLKDSTTYYWRGRWDESGRAGWRQQRFTVRSDLSGEGWLQQGRLFQDNQNTRLEWTPQEQWAFGTYTRNVLISSERGNGAFKGAINVDGVEEYERRTLGFGIVVMDGTTGRVTKNESFCTYEVADNILNERRCGGGVDGTQATDRMENFLQSVDTGDYVFIRTRHLARSGTADISDRVVQLLRTLGSGDTDYSQAIDSLTYEDLWLLQAQKGNPENSFEQVANASQDVNEITRRTDLSFRRPQGETTTSRIGPVSAWDSLEWQADGPPSSSVTVDVLGADSNRVLKRARGREGALSLADLSSSQHPYLRLRATLRDSTTRIPPQLERWRVMYEGVPEVALDPSGLRSVPDTVRQGEEVALSLPISNLGSTTSGPVYVRYEVTDASNATTTSARDTVAALAPGTVDTTSARITTADLPGRNEIAITAQPDSLLERLTTNNTVIQSLFVRADQTPPSLTVLTNGRELPPTPDPINDLQSPNLPFVSAQPSFEISLRDDNPNLALTDTSNLQVFLKGGLPSDNPRPVSDFRRISYASDQLRLLSPDSSASGSLRARFEPDLSTQDSTYTMKVEATDAEGNQTEPYQASFRVQQDQVINDVYPYPNPMSTHTTFAFQVQGGRDEMLSDFSLRIYTLSGRLVRELDRADLDAPLSVGWNTLRWNGRDEDGDRVATGTYLYRVRIEGDEQTFRGDVEKVTVIR